MIEITLISDTHGKHKQIEKDLIGGDILIHAGDFTSIGHKHECEEFLKWFTSLPYRYKVFICGNHELGVEENPRMLKELIDKYQSLIEEDLFYLNESSVNIEGLNIFGSPWTPWFYDWAYNAQKGEEIAKHWEKIPLNTDILVTHGPAHGILDTVVGRWENLGCIDLYNHIQQINPLIHCSGHIHSGYGYKQFRDTHYFNASVLDESYQYTNKPFNIIIHEDKKIEII